MLKRDKARICNLIRTGHRKEIQELLDTNDESTKVCPRCERTLPISVYEAVKSDRVYDYCIVCRREVHKEFRDRRNIKITLKNRRSKMKCSYCNAENDGAYKGPCPQCKPRNQIRKILQGGTRITDDEDIIRLVKSYPVPSDWISSKYKEDLWRFCGNQWNPNWCWKIDDLKAMDIVDLYLLWQELKKEEQDDV